MIVAPLLTVLIDGVPIPTSHPACLLAGRVMAPLMPIVSRLANGATVEPDGSIDLVQRNRHITLAAGDRAFEIDEMVYVPLAKVAKALGATIAYDKRTRTVSVSLEPAVLATMPPYDYSAPRVAPNVVFTATPAPTPRPTVSGIPAPRRTPVDVRSL